MNDRLAIDVITGGAFLRGWVDDAGAVPADFDARLLPEEAAWLDERRPFLLYPPR